MSKKIVNIIIIAICAVTAAGIIAVYNKLPYQIPTHWNIKGVADEYGSRNSLWIMYAVLIGVNSLFLIVAKIDPKKENYKKFQHAFDIFRLVTTVFFAMLIVLSVAEALNSDLVDMTKMIFIMVGILFAIIGNYMPKFRHNYTMGIKTPWTLDSEKVWDDTHRMGAKIWVFGGIATVINSFIFTSNLRLVIFFVIIGIIIIIPVIYSYLDYKKTSA